MHTAVTVKVGKDIRSGVDYYTVNVIRNGFPIVGERGFRVWNPWGIYECEDCNIYIDGLRQAYLSMGVECDVEKIS
jgi:hypothetical protein